MESETIKLVRLSDDEKILFAELDPFEMLERKSTLPEFVLGAVSTDDSKDFDTPVGLMICDILPQVLLVKWLFVSPEKRGEGFGEELLNAAMTSAKAEGKKYLAYYISSEYGREMICPNEEDYLEYSGFEHDTSGLVNSEKLYVLPLVDEEEEYEAEPIDIFKDIYRKLEEIEEEEDSRLRSKVDIGDTDSDREGDEEFLPKLTTWELTAGEVANSSLVGPEKTFRDAIPLSRISLPVLGACIRQGLKQHSYSGFSGDLYSLPVDWFDMELSSCVLSDGKVRGIFLVHKSSDSEYLVEYLFDLQAGSQMQLMQMLRRSATVFAREYAPDTKMKIVSKRVVVKKLLEHLFGSDK